MTTTNHADPADPATGAFLQGAQRDRPSERYPLLLAAYRTVLPPYPGGDVVPFVEVPAPPRLRATDTPAQHVRAMLAVYRSAVEDRTGKRCFTHGRGDITKHKHFAAFAACAAKLVEHDIPPAAWVAFSLDRWDNVRRAAQTEAEAGGKRAKLPLVPPVTWVFAEGRVEKHHGWCTREAYGEARRVIVAPRHRVLLAAWQRLNATLIRLPPEVAVRTAAVKELVARVFPNGWDHEVALARAQANEFQARLKGMVERGAWVWG